MCDFTLPFATQFLAPIAAEKREEPLSKSSYQKIKWFGASVFKQAKVDSAFDWKLPNHFLDVPLPKNGRAKEQGRYATLDDVLNMLAACDRIESIIASRLKISADNAKIAMRVIAVASYSGLRKSEIQGLCWDDLQDGKIQLRRSA